MTTLARPGGTGTDTGVRSSLERRVAVARQVALVNALGREALDAWVADGLRATIAHATAHSPFYARTVPPGIAAAAARGDAEAFRRIPFTTRADLASAYPLGMLAVDRREVVRYDESSGTGNGTSIAAFFTADDWLENNLTVAHRLARVVAPHEVAAIAVPYELAGVGQDLDRALEILGCTIVPLGAASPACSPERMVHAIRQSGASTLVCSGTRALYLGEVARRAGLDPRTELGIDKILMAGEGASPAKKRRLADQWDATAYSMFGMTETNTLAMFCEEQELHLVETRTFFEIVDPATGEPLPDGSVGELAVTTLASRAMPLLRYRTGDTCEIDARPCACGSPQRRLRHRGRMGDRIRVGTGWASQLQVEDVVLGALRTPPYFFAFQVEDDVLTIALPAASHDDPHVRTAIADQAGERFGARVRFAVLDAERFEHALRTSAKPTMQNFTAVAGGTR